MRNLNKILLSSLIALSFSAQAKDEPTTAPAPIAVEAASTAASQGDETASLKTALDAYKKIQVSGDLEKSIDYIYPPIFDKIPKEAMLASFKMAKESGMAPKASKLEQNPVFPVKKYAKGIYTTVPYTMATSMDMTPPVSDKAKTAQLAEMQKNPEELAKFKAFMINMLKASMGNNADLKFQKDSMVVDIKNAGTYLAINEDNAGWKFIDMSPMLVGQIKEVLPKDILDSEKTMFEKLMANAVDPMKAMMDAMPSVK